ncbi:MAG TPA: MFS transporter [Thermoplasmata archaeon]|nr:MFS transporter [Thermoplasmata archaeon]
MATGPTYAEILRHDSMPAFLTAGALQFAGPATALVVLIFVIPTSYGNAGHAGQGAIALALLGLASTVPTFGSAFFSGPLADRHDRHLLLRLANLLSLVATAGLAADLFVRPGGQVAVPFAGGFYFPVWVALALPAWALLVSSATVFRPAYNASVPRLVPTSELGRANGLIYAIAAVTSAVGALGVGVVLSVGSPVYALGFPFGLFLATQVALVGVRADLSPPRPRTRRRILTDVVEGFRYLYGRRDIFEMTVVALVVNFLIAVAFVELGLYVLLWLRLASGFWYGAMVSASTVGTAVGMVTVAHARFEQRAGRVLIVLVLAMGLAVLGLALVRSIWLALPIIFIYGIFPGMIQTVFLSSVQATVPDELLGRVFSADEVGSYALVPIGQTTGGIVTFEVGVQGTYLLAGGSIVALAVVMTGGFRALRTLGFTPQAAAQPAEPA